LELGAGARSLIPVECVGSLFGIGLVAEHLQVNAMLTGFEVMDLNAPKLKLPFEDETFDAIVCNSLPYARDPAAVLGEACRCLNKAGVLVISWSGNSLHQDRMVSSWRKLTGSEQVGRVKELFAGAGLSGQSLRVDVSGPTEGAKLFVVSGSPTPPPQQERQQHAGAAQSWKAAGDGGEEMRVEDAVGPQQLLSALKDKSKKRLDARRQREHDEKPFRVKVVSPPPETLLDDTFYFHPRTHNGDKVTIFEDEYVVSRCKLTYSYRQGRYRLDAKILEVQKTSRYETNEKLNSLVKPSPSAPPPNPP
jgi:SAM-dependent methyltransferase